MIVHALFFDPSILVNPSDTNPTWMMDELTYQVITEDRHNGWDTESGCWVANWIIVPT